MTRIYLTKAQFPKVIGKGGQHIQHIRASCGATVKGLDIDNEVRMLVISGSLRQTLEAFEKVTDILNTSYLQQPPTEPFMVNLVIEHGRVRLDGLHNLPLPPLLSPHHMFPPPTGRQGGGAERGDDAGHEGPQRGRAGARGQEPARLLRHHDARRDHRRHAVGGEEGAFLLPGALLARRRAPTGPCRERRRLDAAPECLVRGRAPGRDGRFRGGRRGLRGARRRRVPGGAAAPVGQRCRRRLRVGGDSVGRAQGVRRLARGGGHVARHQAALQGPGFSSLLCFHFASCARRLTLSTPPASCSTA